MSDSDIGAEVYYVDEKIVAATHDHRGRRVRYEPIKSFSVSRGEIEKLYMRGKYNWATVSSKEMLADNLFVDADACKSSAAEKEKRWSSHVSHSRFCR